ncbi:MAG: CBS domain-containing protein [Thermoplasmata archaeon]|nr:CBS domain-containing protein [Thermoplasmata archaeon]
MNYQRRTVNELMRLNPIKCDPDISVLDAARLMSDKGVGSILVVQETGALGIVTERDILSKIVATGKRPDEANLASIMTSPLVTVSPNADITVAAKLMVKHNIRRLPVVLEKELVGVVTDSDILGASAHLIASSEDLKNLICLDDDTPGEEMAGYCETCKAFSNRLESIDGRLICEECRE